jgi:hypothetical protein
MVECSSAQDRNIVSAEERIVPVPFEVEMQVLCKSTNGNAETNCCVCGQGFVMFWDRQSRTERVAAIHEIQEALRRHHRNAQGPEVHPKERFLVPECPSADTLAGSAMPMHTPTWDL